MAKQLRINISFPKYEKHIYDYLDQHDNASALVRQLVGAYMSGNLQMVQGVGTGFVPVPQPIVQNKNEVSVTYEDEVQQKRNDIIKEAVDITKTGVDSLKSLRDTFI